MKRYVIMTFVTLSLLMAAGTVLAATQADLDRWLDEWAKIRCSPTLSAEAKKAEYTKATEKGNIVTPLQLESMAKDDNKSAEAEKWAKANKDNKIVTILREQASTDARAQTLLGEVYFDGLAGVGVDNAQGIEWLRKAADQGFNFAQHFLGWRYGTGTGIAMDDAQAVIWYHKAAENGYFASQGNLGYRYEHGNGVPKDINKAMAWYRKAAAQGHQPSINDLQRMEAAARSNTASSGSTSGGSQRPAEQKSVCGYCQKSEYGKCSMAPSGSMANKLGNHWHNSTGKTCRWCGTTDRLSNCPFSGVTGMVGSNYVHEW